MEWLNSNCIIASIIACAIWEIIRSIIVSASKRVRPWHIDIAVPGFCSAIGLFAAAFMPYSILTDNWRLPDEGVWAMAAGFSVGCLFVALVAGREAVIKWRRWRRWQSWRREAALNPMSYVPLP